MENMHEYNDNTGLIIFSDGSKLPFDNSKYTSSNEAYEAALNWLNTNHLIGANDDLVMFC